MKISKTYRTVFAIVVVLATCATNIASVAPAVAQTIASPAHADQLTAADIRTLLSRQLSEHVLLIASTTGAVIDKRTTDAELGFKAIDGNSIDLSKSFGAVYGKEVEAKFLPLWRIHIEMVKKYLDAVMVKDQELIAAAQADLIDYSRDLATFIAENNPNLPKEIVTTLAANLVKEHVTGLKDLIDAQVSGDQVKAYQAIRMAYGHMDVIAKVLADVGTKQFPARFPAQSTRQMLNCA